MPKAKAHTASITASPLPSPPSPSITLPTLARLISWPLSLQKRRVSASSTDGAVPSSEPITPPPSPPGQSAPTFKLPTTPRSKITKSHFLECSSGTEPKTHVIIMDSKPECRGEATVVCKDFFECRGAVDVQRLLRLSRGRVVEQVEKLGGTTIVHEKWSCSITKHPNKQATMYRVLITYEATPARSDRPDPGQPIALDQVKGVPGLMTVVARDSRFEGPCTKVPAAA